MPRGAHYEAEIEREGVAVSVTVDMIGDHVHRDVDETSEIVQHAAVQVSARVHESIARGQIPF